MGEHVLFYSDANLVEANEQTSRIDSCKNFGLVIFKIDFSDSSIFRTFSLRATVFPCKRISFYLLRSPFLPISFLMFDKIILHFR